MGKLLHIEDISTKDSILRSKLYFDANVWLYLYCPSHMQSYASIEYSKFYKKALDAGADILIAYPTISEFIHRFIQNQFAISKLEAGNEGRKFKDWRATNEFDEAISDLSDIIATCITGRCSGLDFALSDFSVDKTLSEMSKLKVDFTDLIVASLCDKIGATLVSSDKDQLAVCATVLATKRIR